MSSAYKNCLVYRFYQFIKNKIELLNIALGMLFISLWAIRNNFSRYNIKMVRHICSTSAGKVEGVDNWRDNVENGAKKCRYPRRCTMKKNIMSSGRTRVKKIFFFKLKKKQKGFSRNQQRVFTTLFCSDVTFVRYTVTYVPKS